MKNDENLGMSLPTLTTPFFSFFGSNCFKDLIEVKSESNKRRIVTIDVSEEEVYKKVKEVIACGRELPKSMFSKLSIPVFSHDGLGWLIVKFLLLGTIQRYDCSEFLSSFCYRELLVDVYANYMLLYSHENDLDENELGQMGGLLRKCFHHHQKNSEKKSEKNDFDFETQELWSVFLELFNRNKFMCFFNAQDELHNTVRESFKSID